MSGASASESEVTVTLNPEQAAKFVAANDASTLEDWGIELRGSEKNAFVRGIRAALEIFGVYELLKKKRK